jgi:hypothetical protein
MMQYESGITNTTCSLFGSSTTGTTSIAPWKYDAIGETPQKIPQSTSVVDVSYLYQ